MTSIQPTIRAATASDADAVSTILAEAFLYSPVGDWLIPDPDTRRHVYQDYFRIHVDHTIAHGTLDLTTNKTSVNETSVNETSIDETSIDEASVDETGVDGIAAALWFPRGQRPPDPDDYDERLAAACGVWLHRFQVIDAILNEQHPDTPHHYLAFLGVVPRRQGQGIGSGLLDHYHACLDAENLSAFLEASTERSRDLYLRHGYVLAANAPLTLPEDGPPLWPMWREPGHRPSPVRSVPNAGLAD